MEQKTKKKHHFAAFAILILLIFSAVTVYAYKFPVTMELFDKEVNKILSSAEIEENCTVFSDFSSFAAKIVNGAIYWYEVIKENLSGTFDDSKQIPAFIISSAADFPIKSKNITSLFGERINPVSGKSEIHSGIDIASPDGTEIHTAWPGTIKETGFDEIYGNYIVIEHSPEFYTRYCHLSEISVNENDFVNIDIGIGKAGNTGWSTGSHLHFEVEIDGTKIDPMECFGL